MRFDLQQNVMCLLYEHPLLLERPRSWTPKNHHLATERPLRPDRENGPPATTVEPVVTFKFEGEVGPAAPAPAVELINLPLENGVWRRLAAP